MKFKQTPIASAVAFALISAAFPAHAQQANKNEPERATEKKQAVDTVIVTGIRAALERSLDVKRNAESHVDVITAEDIGKMPDKNVADSLQRVPGVTISPAGAGRRGTVNPGEVW